MFLSKLVRSSCLLRGRRQIPTILCHGLTSTKRRLLSLGTSALLGELSWPLTGASGQGLLQRRPGGCDPRRAPCSVPQIDVLSSHCSKQGAWQRQLLLGSPPGALK